MIKKENSNKTKRILDGIYINEIVEEFKTNLPASDKNLNSNSFYESRYKYLKI